MTKAKPKLAEVITFPVQLADVAAMLRKLADEVEAGDLGEVVNGVTVISGDDIEVRGWGKVDGMTAIATLALGQAWIVNNTLKEMEEG